jgi:hypothetical protein
VAIEPLIESSFRAVEEGSPGPARNCTAAGNWLMPSSMSASSLASSCSTCRCRRAGHQSFTAKKGQTRELGNVLSLAFLFRIHVLLQKLWSLFNTNESVRGVICSSSYVFSGKFDSRVSSVGMIIVNSRKKSSNPSIDPCP